MTKKIAAYLDGDASGLLKDGRFASWTVEKEVRTDLKEPITFYSFPEHGLEFRCDGQGRISSIFVHADDFDGFKDGLLDVSLSWDRSRVLERFGPPSKSGERLSDPVLGEYGAWDRFTLPGYVVHVEYGVDRDEIKRLTLMREESVPYAAFP